MLSRLTPDCLCTRYVRIPSSQPCNHTAHSTIVSYRTSESYSISEIYLKRASDVTSFSEYFSGYDVDSCDLCAVPWKRVLHRLARERMESVVSIYYCATSMVRLGSSYYDAIRDSCTFIHGFARLSGSFKVIAPTREYICFLGEFMVDLGTLTTIELQDNHRSLPGLYIQSRAPLFGLRRLSIVLVSHLLNCPPFQLNFLVLVHLDMMPDGWFQGLALSMSRLRAT